MSVRRPPGLFAILALVGVLAACQAAPAATPTASPASPGTAAGSSATGASPAAATAIPAASPAAQLFDVEVADTPFLVPADGPEGSRWPMPAAGTRAADGTLVLVVVWFADGGSPPRTTIATSVDRTAWDVGTEHVFGDLEIGAPDPGPIPGAIVQLADGTWQIYGWVATNSSGTAFSSWRTSAPSLAGPWALDGIELLPSAPAGDWDSYMTAPGSVLPTEDGFAMWYEGEPPGSSNRGDIGLAASTDGLGWTKHDDAATTAAPFAASDPVIRTGICGDSTAVAVEQPQVERAGDGFVALFGGYGAEPQTMGVFGAVSDDGRTWRCGGAEPLLSGSALAGGEGIHTIASLPLGDGRIGLVAESLSSDHSELWWATVTVKEE